MLSLTSVALIIYTVASAIVGVRLLMRASRSHGVPELLAGISYVAAPALGYPMVIVASMMANRAIAVPVYVVGEILLVSGCCCFLFFTMTVFRPGSVWAMWTAGFGTAVLAWSGLAITRAYLSSTDPLEIAAHARA